MLLQIGSEVEMKQSDKIGVVLAVCIRGKEKNISYECVWWESGNRKTAWFESIEIYPKGTDRLKIGFKQ